MADKYSQQAIPVGPRLEAVIELAWRARKPVLLRGGSGIGKSEILASTAQRRGIDCRVLDLSLLEPPDLTGLPYIELGRTLYAAPALLPKDGEGILVLEELNRADRAVRQPVLQLLSARRLNEYQLPPGWSVVASINPAGGDYQVDDLDPALTDRFLTIDVRPDREVWLEWAASVGVHAAVLELAKLHEHALENVSPRTWKHVSDLLHVARDDPSLSEFALRDALPGYLPSAWLDELLALRERRCSEWSIDVHGLLRDLARNPAAQSRLAELRMHGRTDLFEQIAFSALHVVSSREIGKLSKHGGFDLESFEHLLAALPGDHAVRLQTAFGGNPDSAGVIGIPPDRVLAGYVESGAAAVVMEWHSRRATRHRAWSLAAGLVHALDRRPDIDAVRRSHGARMGIGTLLATLAAPHDRHLRDALIRMKIDPILPQAARD